jgi:murein DD-endopeptidase MepM/ murein hydrolase activator NlpD
VGLGVKLGAPLMASGAGMIKTGLAGAVAGAPTGVGALPGLAVAGTGLLTFLAGGALMVGGPIVGDLLGKGIGTIGGSMNYWNRRNAEARPEWAKSRNSRGRARNRSRRAYLERRQQRQDEREEKKRLQLERTPTEATSAREPSMSRRSWFDRPANRPSLRQRRLEGRLQPQFVASAMIADDMGMMALDFEQKIDIETSKKNATSYFSLIPQKSNQEKLEEYIDSVQDADQHEEKSEGFLQWLSRAFGWLWDKSSSFAPSILAAANPVFGAGFSIYNAGRQFIQGRNGVRQEYQQFVQGLGRGATAIGNTIRGIPGRMFPGLSTPNTEAEIPKSPGLIITEILSGGAFTGSTGIVGSLRGSPIAESQVSGNYRAVTLPGMGEVIITGGYMEPHGHAPKGSLKAIFSSDPNQIVNLPPSGRNIGIDLVPTEGQVARAILPGTVESIDWSQGMGPVVVKRTDRTFKYKGKEFPVFIEYEHLGQNTVKPGDRVKVGQIVGRGWDGGGTGFHYGVDPYIYVPGEGQVRVAPNLIFGEQATKKDTTPIIPAKTKVEYGKGQTIKSGRSATLSDAEFYTLAATSLLEAIPIGSGGGKQAVADVAHTVMARVHSTRHENDVISVAFSPSQFEVADGYNRSSFTTREGVIKALMTDRSYSRKAAEQAIQTFESVMADGDYLKNSVDSLQGRLNFQVGSYSWGGAIINRHGHNFSNPDPAVKDKVPFIIKRGPQTNLFGGTTFKKEGEVSITYNLGALVESVNQSLSERQDKFRFNVNQALEPDRFIKELQGLYLAGKLNQEQLNLLRADIMTHNRLTAKGFVLQYPDYDTTMKAMSGSFNPDDVKSRINNVTSLLARSNNTIAMAEGILGDDPGTKFAENQARQYPHKYKGAVYVPNAPSFLAQVDPNLNLKMREYAKAIVSQDSLLLTTPEVWDQMVASKHDRRPSLRNTKPDPSSIDTVGYYVYGDATLKVRQGANVDPEMIASMSLEILERRLEYQIFQTQGRTPTSVNHLNTLVGDHLSREQKLENVYQHLIKFGDDPGKFATNQIRPWLTNSRDPAIKAALKEVENLESAAGDPKTKTLGNVAEQLRLHRKSGLLPRHYPTPEGPGQVEIGTLTQEDLAKRHHETFEAVRSLPLDDPRRKAANYLPKEIYLVRPPEQTRIGTDSKRAGLNPQLSAELYAEMERLAPSFGLKVVLSSPTQSYKESLKEARARELERSAYALMISFNRGGVFTPGVGTVDPKFGGSINVLDLYLHQGALDLGSLSQYDKFINSKGEWERHHNISRASEMGVSHLELGQLRRMLASEVEGNGVVDRRELRRLASHLLVSIGAAAGHGSLQFTPGRTQQGGLTMRVAQRTSNFVQAGARAGSSGGPSGRGYRTPAQVQQSQRPVYRAPIGPTRPGQSYLAPIGPTRPGQSHLPPIGPQPRGSGGSSQGATWSTPRSPSRPTPARGSAGTQDRNIFQRGGDWIRRRIPGLNRRSSALENNVYAFAGSEFDPSTRNLESSIQATEQIAMREASPTYRESVDPSLAEPRFDIANDLRTGSLESAVGSAYISESETERTRAVQVFLSQASAAIDSVEAKTKQQEPKAVQIQTHKTALASTDRYEKALRPTRSSEPVAVVIENPNGNKEVYVDLNNPLPSHVTGVPDMQDYASNDTYLSSYSYS